MVTSSFSEIFQANQTPSWSSPRRDYPAKAMAHQQWYGAIAAMEHLLMNHSHELDQGLIISSPVPVITEPTVMAKFTTAVLKTSHHQFLSLNPASCNDQPWAGLPNCLDSSEGSPLDHEQFCWVLTQHFSLLMVLGFDSQGAEQFYFSFEPSLQAQAWELLARCDRSREIFKVYRQQFPFIEPKYTWVSAFSTLMLHHLTPPQPEPSAKPLEPLPLIPTPPDPSQELKLLQVLTHEIRTPLTSIRTLIRSLIKRYPLPAKVMQRLRSIDQECTEQIERMELIFRATELESNQLQTTAMHLSPISLQAMFEHNIPRWQQQAQRRNIHLEVLIPQQLPQVITEPALLDRMLTGLIEKFTRNLTTGDRIQLHVSTAGNQLKLKLLPETSYQSSFEALGQLLTFQPSTGNVSLNLNVTKNLCQALGGKLIVKNKPAQGESFTIFLPLGKS